MRIATDLAYDARMKAYRLVGAHRAELCEVPIPEPGPGQVLVKVAGAGLCHSDLHILHSPLPPAQPYTLGHETAGWVAQVGAGVTGFERDEPVLVHGVWGCGRCKHCQTDREQYCLAGSVAQQSSGLGRDGGIAEYLLVPAARHLVPLGGLDPYVAAPLDDAALTPYHAIKSSHDLLVPDAAVVAIGIGGLGHMAIQLLRALCSARIVAVDVSQDKLALARRMGADATVLSGEKAADEIRELLHGRGAQLVLDFVGVDDTLALATRIVEPLSHICVVGIGMGQFPFSFGTLPMESSMSTTFWGSVGELREVVALAQAGRIQVHAEHFALEQTASAYERLEAGKIEGRAIVRPGG